MEQEPLKHNKIISAGGKSYWVQFRGNKAVILGRKATLSDKPFHTPSAGEEKGLRSLLHHKYGIPSENISCAGGEKAESGLREEQLSA